MTKLSWKVLVTSSIFWFSMSMATAYDAWEDPNGRWALPLVLLLQAILLLFAAITVFQANEANVQVAWPSLDKGGRLIFVGFSILYLILLIRLLCFRHFGGSVGSFSFGKKDCWDDDVCDENEAFSLSFNTFGHVIQGCLSFFLFSDIQIGGISEIEVDNRRKRKMMMIYMKESIAICSCIYPIYNILKRAFLHADTFSTSSFWNNGSEWACGFAIGTCAIYSYYAIMYTSFLGRNSSRFNKLEHIRESPQQLPRLRIAAGVALIIVALVSIILLAASWNHIKPVAEISDSGDVQTTLLLLILPSVIITPLVLYRYS